MRRGPQNASPEHNGVWSLDELEEKVIKPTSWGSVGSRTYKAFSITHPKLPAGAYTISLDRNDDRIIYVRRDVKTDRIISFKDSLASGILKEVGTFWNRGQKFAEVGFLHRRGYLLYGPQGTGKSSLVQQIVADVVKRDGVVLICENPKFFNMALTTFRQTEPDRNLVCIFEDIDAIIKRYGEDELLSILDGSNMVTRVLNIATTNYPELLDRRIISRPRRFDRVIKIEAPIESIRREFLKQKLPKSANLKEWVETTNGLSFAGMAEAIISVYCLGNGLTETLKILRDIEKGHPSSDDFGKKVGFDAAGDIDEDDDDDL